MSRGRRSVSVKRGLLASVAVIVVAMSAQAHAQAPGGKAPVDGLEPGQLYMEADLVIRDDKNKITTARGEAEVRYEGRTLRADELVYDEARGVMTAKGQVQIINADGSIEYADELVLDEAMKAGVATGFAARLAPSIKLAAATAVRRSERVNELNRAIYTPCEICAADGSPKSPTWSIKADKVVQDRDRQLIYYRNAVIRIFGAPVLYLPLFWHPDPQAVRKSGFLPPKLGASNRRGLSYEQPYLQVLSPSSDITLSPQINTKVNPFFNGHYRKRFYSGAIDARFGYTYDEDFDGKGNRFGDATSRSYVLASGQFAIDERWNWGFTAERTSDDLLFDKYEIGDVYAARGPYIADDRRLISQVYATRQDQRSYFSAAAFSIQGLRPGDNDRAFPFVGPLIEARWEPQTNIAGGRLRLLGSAVALTREESPLSVAPQRLPGLDSRRVTGEVDWRATFTAPAGIRVSPFVNLRGDAYALDDLNTVKGASKTLSRGLAVAGADITWPFVRRFSDSTVILEPIVQIAASPNARQVVVGTSATGAPVYLNEDSVAFEFDETNLFRANKFPGYDLYEDGVRVNAGGRASVFWDDGRRASLLVGRSFRNQSNDVFSPQSGLRQTRSDWIVAADAQPIKGLSFFARTRLDSDDLTVQRAEAGANLSMKRANGYFRYLRDRANANGVKVENLDLGGDIYLTKHWGLTAYGNRDLVQDAWVIRDLGVTYRDDCTRVDIIYRREDTVVGRLGPTESLAIRLTLATLGGPLYAN
ncbi:LPS-assembly protein LptD [Phenylobacterium sp.]|uniref:LPS-assembly protein LptD n=1 Tax=Phenylobacterium sp. TaxID=1871053 RepID=UPI00272708C0|nr:LPS-assembly protein LptD [Phenylobacterium sp.]MDO8377437.1 LPS-assembly protein LptD [Phenylobacterium sp.]